MSSSKIYSLQGKNLRLSTRDEAQSYVDELAKVEDLEEVHLGGNTLGVEACQAIGEVLATKKTLKVADFADIFTGRLISEIPSALRALCDSLVSHEGLEEVDLSDNAFGGRSAEPMVNLLTNNHSIRTLKLNNNGLGIQGGTIVADALYEAAQKMKGQDIESNLRTFVCGRNRLEDGSSAAWARAFSAHGKIEEVRMFQNGIRMKGIENLVGDGLSKCPNLRVLDLNDNTATLRGSKVVAKALPGWAQLETLNLGDCLLRPKGGKLVIDAFAKGKNVELETLLISYCELDREVLSKMGDVLEQNRLPALAKLDINGNFADEEDECIEKIKKALDKTDKVDALAELDELDPEGEVESDEEAEDEEEEEESEAEEVEEEKEKEEPDVEKVEDDKKAAVGVIGVGAVGDALEVESQMKDIKISDENASTAKGDGEFMEEQPGDAHVVGLKSNKGPKAAAEDAAEVAESAQEVPQEEEAAEKAAEVAESAQEVPEEKEAAEQDAEVAESAQGDPQGEEGAGLAAEVAQQAEMAELDKPENSKLEAHADGKETQTAIVDADVDSASIEKSGETQEELIDDTSGTSSNEAEAVVFEDNNVERTAAAAAGVGAVAAGVAAATAIGVSDAADEATSYAPTSETGREAPAAMVLDDPDGPDESTLAPVEGTIAADGPEEKENTVAPATEAVHVAEVAPTIESREKDRVKKEDQELSEMLEQTHLISTPAPPTKESKEEAKGKGSHQNQGSVDLSGELYEGRNADDSSHAQASSSQLDNTQTPTKKKGFRAAMGAIRELLR